MELFDVCDEFGNPTGEVTARKVAHAKGLCHRTAHVWICEVSRESVKVLLQKRAQGKDSFPGCYDTSSAGHIQAGDQPLESALRELEEELGIKASAEELSFIGTFRILYESEFYGEVFKDNEVAYVYTYEKSVDPEMLQLQQEEVEAVRWFDLEEVYQAVCRKDPAICVPEGGIRMIREYYHSR